MSKILLVEDDPVLGRSLSIKLELESYQVVWLQTLRAAQQRLKEEEFQLLLLDVGLPDGSGIEFLKKNRDTLPEKMVIIVLTARSDEDTAVESLECGAHDFIRKPFGSRELSARIKRALSEPLNHEPQLRVGDLLILLEQRKIIFKESTVDLNRREFEIFKFLAQNIDRVVHRETLIAALGSGSDIVDRTVDSHISHIRAKLKEKNVDSLKIAPVYGLGTDWRKLHEAVTL